MRKIYPLRFKPIAREMIWGGDNLRKNFNKNFPGNSRIGESWEISAYPGFISVVDNGFLKGNNIEELIGIYMGDLVGEKVFDRFGLEFPLLIKLIDAREVLSVQVHPDDEVAAKHHNARGKTEMWYILDAEPGAELISGFNQNVTPEIFLDKVKSGGLLEILNVEKVSPGDIYFMPAGRVHAIGKGIILAEIQQTSDSTFRIFDWGRRDAEGNYRQLHLEDAMQAIDFNFYNKYKTEINPRLNSPVLIADCQYFTTHLLNFKGILKRDYSLVDSFVIYICTNGEFMLEWDDGKMAVKKGDSLLIPASIEEVSLTCGNTSGLLEVHIK
jgi:mannose-6-phosphate isomerase